MYRQTGKPGQVRGGRPFISGPESRPFEISIGGREKDSTENNANGGQRARARD